MALPHPRKAMALSLPSARWVASKFRKDWPNLRLAVAYDRMMTSRFFIGVVLAWGIADPVFAQGEFVARVLTVHEGDRLTILHQGRSEMVSLRNVDCPEPKQPYAKQARHATAGYVGNREVVVRELTRDPQGRMTAEILLHNGKLLTHELIREGLAWVRSDTAHDPALHDLEELAKAAGKGLWAEPNPVPPWKWKPTKPIHRN